MKNWTTFMTAIAGFLIVFSHFDSYASTNTVEKFPFKILKDNENFYYKVTTLKKQKMQSSKTSWTKRMSSTGKISN